MHCVVWFVAKPSDQQNYSYDLQSYDFSNGLQASALCPRRPQDCLFLRPLLSQIVDCHA